MNAVLCQLDAISDLVIRKGRDREIATGDMWVITNKLREIARDIDQERSLIAPSPRRQYWEDFTDGGAA